MKNSSRLLKKSHKLIPGLSQTFSKSPYSYVEGAYPSFISRGTGSHVFDVDNNEYIDYVMALGPIILGYNSPPVKKAITNQLKNGILFSIPHYLEVDASETIGSVIPGAEMIRFAKTGSDAGTAAIRAARAFTKRDNIAYCGHGGVWHDWFTVMTSRNEGIPKILKSMIKKFHYNDIESLKIIFEDWKGELSSVFMEPAIEEYPKKNFLENVKKLCKKHGTVLIFDEVITGFRFSIGGGQKLFNVTSDLAVFGKALGNGMPIAAITGKHEIMEKFNDVFFSTTYGGETLSLAASIAVINEMKNKPVIEHCWDLGKTFMEKFNQLASTLDVNIRSEGIPVRSSITCYDENNKPSLIMKSLFFQETIKKGILFGPGNVFFSYAHSNNDLKKTLAACEHSMKILKNAIDSKTVEQKLKGNVMKTVMTF